MKIQAYLLVFSLLSIVPGLLARLNGAPPDACASMMPNHGTIAGQSENMGYYIISDAISDYIPGQEYLVELRAESEAFKGFFIQARIESNQGSTASIVGVWTPLNTSSARMAICNGVDGDSITHSSNDAKNSQFFTWRAPDNDVGRIHFIYSVVHSFVNFFVRLNATQERPAGVIGPPTQPPANALYPNSYGQPQNCEQDECDFYVEWRNNGEFVDFRMEGSASGWIVLGLVNTNIPLVGRVFSDILMCQTEPTGGVVNVKDLFLSSESTTPMFDSSVNGTEYISGRITSGRIFCNFSRVGFVLVGQENQDVSFSDEIELFFLSGVDTGNADDIPADFSNSVRSPIDFSPTMILDKLQLGTVEFSNMFSALRGKGSFPTSGCDPDDCDFYFRWDVNPSNPNFLTFYINADIARGWAAIGVSHDKRMGGNEIDDVFGCVTVNTNGVITVAAIDTYNLPGGQRQNVGDGELEGIVLHEGAIVNGRIICIFSRVVSVLSGSEAIDLNLNRSYYILIGIGQYSGTGSNFLRHHRNPQVSTSKVNLARETFVDFDYAKIPLIKTHGVIMIFAWPVLAYLGIMTARYMEPALPNGSKWILLHTILGIMSFGLTCIAFILIIVAFRNTTGSIALGDMNRSGTAHFGLGIIILILQFTNPIIAFFRVMCKKENQWIFNVLHLGVIGFTCQVLSSVNVCIGLYLFGEKYTYPEQFVAFWVIFAFFIVFAIIDVAFGLYQALAFTLHKDWVITTDNNRKEKLPSRDHILRWGVWIFTAIVAVIFAIIATVFVGIG